MDVREIAQLRAERTSGNNEEGRNGAGGLLLLDVFCLLEKFIAFSLSFHFRVCNRS